MARGIKFTLIFGLLVVLLITYAFPAVACTGPVVSHACVGSGSSDTVALVVWPGASGSLSGSVGQLTVHYTGGSFTMPLTYVSTTGTSSKWQGTVPSGHTGTLFITSGWVVNSSHTIENLPFSFVYGKSCSPTAVELKGISAHSQPSSPLILFGTIGLAALGVVVVKRH